MFSRRRPIKYTQFFGHQELERLSETATRELQETTLPDLHIPCSPAVQAAASFSLRNEFRGTIAEPILPHLVEEMLTRRERSKIDTGYWSGSIVSLDYVRSCGVSRYKDWGRAAAVIALNEKLIVGDSRDESDQRLLHPGQALLIPSGMNFSIAASTSPNEQGGLVAVVRTQHEISL